VTTNGYVLVKYDDAGEAWFVDASGRWSDRPQNARLFQDESAAANAKLKRDDWASIRIERIYEGPWGPERRRW
jgi:hypothetical protein